jgi:hypothetical protein
MFDGCMYVLLLIFMIFFLHMVHEKYVKMQIQATKQGVNILGAIG